MKSCIFFTTFMLNLVSGKILPYRPSSETPCYVPEPSSAAIIVTSTPSSYSSSLAFSSISELPFPSKSEGLSESESSQVETPAPSEDPEESELPFPSESLSPTEYPETSETPEPSEQQSFSLPSSVVDPSSTMTPSPSASSLPDDSSSTFKQLVGNYVNQALQSTPTPKCDPNSNVLLSGNGIIVRNYCFGENSTDTKYTFGTWGYSQGKLIERLNAKDKDISYNSTLNIAVQPSGINLNGTSLVKRNETRLLDSVLDIFGSFQSQNCTQTFISSLSLAPTGKYSIAKCPKNQPVSIENGLFTIDSVTGQKMISLVLYPDQSFMHPAKVQVLGDSKIVYEGALLTKSSKH